MSESGFFVYTKTMCKQFGLLPEKDKAQAGQFLLELGSGAFDTKQFAKVTDTANKDCYSYSVSSTCQVLLKKDKQGVFFPISVGMPDAVHDWACKYIFEINPVTGTAQEYEVQSPAAQDTITPQKAGVFDFISDEKMIQLGLPKESIPHIRMVRDKEDYQKVNQSFPENVACALMRILNGKSNLELEIQRAKNTRYHPGIGIRDALAHPDSLTVAVADTTDATLQMMLKKPLDEWRVFLFPEQRSIIEKDYNGPTLVAGGAGTGKTVVAMHWVKKLYAELKKGEKILFTMFSKTLVKEIEENLCKLLDVDTLPENIIVNNIDALAVQYYKEKSGKYARTIYKEADSRDMWEAAIKKSGAKIDRGLEFYQEEWRRVVLEMPAITRERYRSFPRKNQDKLGSKQREEVWKVVNKYKNEMKAQGRFDKDYMLYEAGKLAQKSKKGEYTYIVIDEAQDITRFGWKFLSGLRGETHRNDVFAVGDSRQRIYGDITDPQKTGIKFIKSRSFPLSINYRTTQQIYDSAIKIFAGEKIQALAMEKVEDIVTARIRGKIPDIKGFSTIDEEVDFIAKNLKKYKVEEYKDICVLARSKIDTYTNKLKSKGIMVHELNAKEPDDRKIPGVRLATMHRAKGLEFKWVFIAGLNKGILPNKQGLYKAQQKGDPEAIKTTILREKCTLYVAMTRARDMLFMTYYQEPSEFIELIK